MILKLKRLDKFILFFILAFVISFSLIQLFETRFDESLWKDNPRKRYKMVDDLIESQLLMNKTKSEVRAILGIPQFSSTEPQDILIYGIGEPPSFVDSKREHLLLIFEDQRVIKVTLAFDD
ncbi:hypothetical protein [Winogradskyella tangerina]|uniref:hypothetical protein n=1 Tax=Winogradskyella tangerina TaxID=2023240 RepID=UPI000DBE0203|nr:hypothetical protein [Winogradskyella tangerina]